MCPGMDDLGVRGVGCPWLGYLWCWNLAKGVSHEEWTQDGCTICISFVSLFLVMHIPK